MEQMAKSAKLDDTLHAALKIEAARQKISMQDLLNKIVSEFLGRRGYE